MTAEDLLLILWNVTDRASRRPSDSTPFVRKCAHTRLMRHIYIGVKSGAASPDSLGPDSLAMQPCALWTKSDREKITKTGGTDVVKSQVSILPLHDSICGSNPAVVSVGNSCRLEIRNLIICILPLLKFSYLWQTNKV